MKLNEQTLEYLKGKKFSNSLVIDYPFYENIPSRIDLLCNIVKGKAVLHLGCLDHLPLISEKIRTNQWLHKELTDAASVCLGVDIDSNAEEFVRKTFGFKNIVIGNFTSTQLKEISERKWDFAILGELLEHVNNPVHFLQDIAHNYSHCISRLLITVPNAWTKITIHKANQSKEIINSDHRYWFTPYTLSKVIVESGMFVEELFFTNRVPLSVPQLLRKKIYQLIGKNPSYNFTYASSIVAMARFNNVRVG
jgi:hypothetical protein